MIATVDPVNAYVLAGGRSLRMGQDKAFLELGGYTLLERALGLARGAAGNAWIAGSAAKFAAFGPVVEDVYRECGPLAGIHAALAGAPNDVHVSTSDVKTSDARTTDLNLMLAVDLPFVRLDFLKYLIARARQSNAAVVVPMANGRLQPLCAIYRHSFAEAAERSLLAGRYKIDSLFTEVSTTVIGQEELEQEGFSGAMFRNLNTPEDWEAARQWASDGKPRASA
jgi:molybdopterin-guanine dinucleotide biosynthesis protein A